MKGNIYNPGHPVAKEDLQYESFSIKDDISTRVMRFARPGAVSLSQFGTELKPFEVTAAVGLFVNVGSGVAISGGDIGSSDPTKPGGEFITIPAGDTDPGDNWRRSPGSGPGTGTGTGPYKESTDGAGGWTSTPESTLTRNVPVAAGVSNYIWLGYMLTVDPSYYSLHKITGARRYPRGTDGYDIAITTTPSAPTNPVTGSLQYLLIARVDVPALAVSVNPGDIVLNSPDEAGTTDRFLTGMVNSVTPTSSYGDGTATFAGHVYVDDHVNSLGTGTMVRPTNPHRLKVTDLDGFDDVESIVRVHQKEEHSDGIVGTPASTLGMIIDNTPGFITGAIVEIQKLVSGEAAYISGYRFTSVLPSDISIGGNAYIQFSVSDPVDSYYLFLYVSSGVCTTGKISTGSGVPSGVILLGSADWSGGVLSSLVDLRRYAFGNISSTELKMNSVLSAAVEDADGTSGQDTEIGSGVKTPHLQNECVTTPKILDANITEPKHVTGGVSNRALADGSVTEIKNADNSVSTRTIINGNVTTPKLADGAVTQDKLSVSLVTTIYGSVPVGSIIPYAAIFTMLPSNQRDVAGGWSLCDGKEVSRTDPAYLNLYNAILTTWGDGNGSSTFNLPDMRGAFMRGCNNMSSDATDSFQDPDRASRVARHGGNTGNLIGSYQMDENKAHTHPYYYQALHIGPSVMGGSTVYFDYVNAVTSSSGGNESRPKNAYVNFIIKL